MGERRESSGVRECNVTRNIICQTEEAGGDTA